MTSPVPRAALPDEAWRLHQAGYTNVAIGEMTGYSESTIRRVLRSLTLIHPPATPSPTPQLLNEIRLTGNGPITADWHLPLTDYALVDRMVREAVELNLTDWLVVAGDFFNFDALSDYNPKQADAGLERELSDAAGLMRQLLSVFDKVYVTLGNHDLRLQRALGFKLRFEHSIKMCFPGLSDSELERIIVTGRDYVLVDSPLGTWRVCHTNSYSAQPLAYPNKLADRHRQHVAGGHRHHHALGHSSSGYMTAELGGLFDAERTEYTQRWSNAFSRWQQGYLFLIDGRPFAPLLSFDPRAVA